MIEAQGGDGRVVDRPSILPRAPVWEPLVADRDGVVAAFRAEEIGLASVALGAEPASARAIRSTRPSVSWCVGSATGCDPGSPSAEFHARDPDAAAAAARGSSPRWTSPRIPSAAAHPRMDVSLGGFTIVGVGWPSTCWRRCSSGWPYASTRASGHGATRRSDPAAVGSDHTRPEGLVRTVRRRVRAGPDRAAVGGPGPDDAGRLRESPRRSTRATSAGTPGTWSSPRSRVRSRPSC